MQNKNISVDLPILIHDTDNSVCNTQVKKYCEEFTDSQNQTSNVKADMSSYQIWQETDLFNDLLSMVVECVDNHPWAKHLQSWFIRDAWLARYKKGQSTNVHHHIPAHLSFVYYLKGSEKSSPLNLEGIDIELVEGRLIIFPSLMMHSVSTTPAERIVLAGNINSGNMG